MESRTRTLAIAAAAVAVAVVLFVVLQGSGGDDGDTAATSTITGAEKQPGEDTGSQGQGGSGQTPDEPEVATIVVRNGQPVGGVQELEFAKGDSIRFVVESDVDEEVHLHGYDIAKDVASGGEVSFDVPATIEGVFEVELEHSVVPLAEITVTPG